MLILFDLARIRDQESIEETIRYRFGQCSARGVRAAGTHLPGIREFNPLAHPGHAGQARLERGRTSGGARHFES